MEGLMGNSSINWDRITPDMAFKIGRQNQKTEQTFDQVMAVYHDYISFYSIKNEVIKPIQDRDKLRQIALGDLIE